MPPNPARLNALQLKTLTLLQEIARHPIFADEEADGGAVVHMLPDAHGDHFHIGQRVVLGRDATGLSNPAVMTALARKGMIVNREDAVLELTAAGRAYATGLRDRILHGSDH